MADSPDSSFSSLSLPTVKYMAKRVLSEFSRDGGTDQAAKLTYFMVLSIAPTLLALFSLATLLLAPIKDQIAELITEGISSAASGSELRRRRGRQLDDHLPHGIGDRRHDRADHRYRHRPVVRLRLHQGLRQGHEPGLRGAGGSRTDPPDPLDARSDHRDDPRHPPGDGLGPPEPVARGGRAGADRLDDRRRGGARLPHRVVPADLGLGQVARDPAPRLRARLPAVLGRSKHRQAVPADLPRRRVRASSASPSPPSPCRSTWAPWPDTRATAPSAASWPCCSRCGSSTS